MEKDSINELTFQLMNEYYKKVIKYSYKDGKQITKNYKMAGNIFAMIIKRYIKKIIDKNKKEDKDSIDDGVNIYNESDVKCIIELKTASHFFSEPLNGKKDEERKNFFKYCINKDFNKIFENIPNKIQYLYISLFQSPKRGAEYIKEVVKNYNNKDKTTFFFIENNSYNEKKIIESIENKTKEYIKGDFEKFIIDALKD